MVRMPNNAFSGAKVRKRLEICKVSYRKVESLEWKVERRGIYFYFLIKNLYISKKITTFAN